eukprot:m.9717 g.9717  ORF g.9717 m.9717 type:complete len:467 (+) comp21583_c0_seq1:200-1600(+)
MASMVERENSRDDTPELDGNQTEKLAHFQELTGKTDVNESRQLLEQYGWNLEIAVEAALNAAERPSPPAPAPAVRHRFPRSGAQGHVPPPPAERFIVARRRNRQPPTWSQWAAELFLIPFRFAGSTLLGILRFLGSLFSYVPSQASPRAREEVAAFTASFDSRYGEEHPPFLQCSYTEAVAKARQDIRFLLVYLHSWDHQQTDEFCQKVVCTPGFKEYVEESMIMWACDINSREGYGVSQVMRESTYPFLAIVCIHDTRMEIVDRIEGYRNCDELLARFIETVENNEPSLVVAREERHHRSESVALRQQQDSAYLESLRKDEEKERKKKEEREALELKEEKRMRKEQEEKERVNDLSKLREHKKKEMPGEPEPNDKDSTKIVIRFPSGKRLERKFKKTDSLQTLYDFVFCEDETLDDHFILITNYPRKELRLDNENSFTTLEQFNLFPSASLFVHTETADEDDDTD